MGKNCKQEPLSQAKRDEILQGVEQEDIEVITDDEVQVPQDAEAIRKDMERMKAEREALKKQAEEVQKGLKMAEEQELLKEWQKMKDDLDKMHQLVEDQQAKLINFQSKFQDLEVKDNESNTEQDKNQSGMTPVNPAQPPPVAQQPHSVQYQPGALGQNAPVYMMHGQAQSMPGQSFSFVSPVPAQSTVQQPVVYPPGGPATGITPSSLGQVHPVPVAQASSHGHPPVFKVPTTPAPRTPSTPVDPSLQVYANAMAGQYAQSTAPQPGVASQAASGIDMARVFADNPQLAAACGMSTQPSTDQGKCLAEQYIYKPQYKTVDRPSYYDFIHGAMRMMKTRLLQDHLPIDDFLSYYEYIACLATQYRWHAVYDVHVSHVAEIENKRKKWCDPVDANLKERYCNAGSHLPDKDARPTRRDIPRGSRDHKRGGGPGDRGGDVEYFTKSRSASASSGWKPTCDLFNKNPYSCTFDPCRYRHECSDCESRGIRAPHSKSFCENVYSGNRSGTHAQSGQHNGQAGVSGR